MTHREIIKEMLEHRGCSQKKLAREMGTQACTVTVALKSDNMYTKTFLKMCNILNYEIVVRPKNHVRAIPGEMIFDEKS